MELRKPSDEQVLAAIAAGELHALAILYDRHGGQAFGLARRIVAERALAEEIVQEVFVAVIGQAVSYDPSRAPVRSWLLAMVHHKSVDVVRREESLRRRAEASGRLNRPAPVRDPAEAAWDVIVAEQVRSALDVLSDDERRAIEIAYFGGHTYRETAELLETPEGTIKTRMRSGLRKLREALEERGVVRPWLTT